MENAKTDKKIYDGKGKVVADPEKERKALIEELTIRLQGTADSNLSGIKLASSIDVVGNQLFEMITYAQSLHNAVSTIEKNYPNEDSQDLFDEMKTVCEAVVEGASRTQEYIDGAKNFAKDLDGIRSSMWDKIQKLHWEI